jgi:hypothetical protein
MELSTALSLLFFNLRTYKPDLLNGRQCVATDCLFYSRDLISSSCLFVYNAFGLLWQCRLHTHVVNLIPFYSSDSQRDWHELLRAFVECVLELVEYRCVSVSYQNWF